MKCAIYRRVSTEMQREEGYSLDAQKSRLLSYIESQGWTLTEDYADEGVSAKDIDRPALQRMLADMAAGKFEVLLVYRLDRLVRSVTDLHNLLTLFEKHGVKFKSATEVFDTTSAMGRLFITMVGAMAQWERENLAERVSLGMMKRHEEGQRNGAAAPFGYDNGKDGVLVINEDEAKWVRYIFESFKTKGRRTLAVELNNAGVRTKRGELWNDFGLNYVVANPVYYGALRWNYRKANGARTYEETVVTGEHEAIITKELYDEVQAIRSARKGTGYRSDTHYPYTGVLKCARCGKTMIGAKRKRKNGYQRFYRCRGRFTYGICDMPIIPEEVVDKYFVSLLRTDDLAPRKIEADTGADNADIYREIEKTQRAMKKLRDMFKWDMIEEDEFKSDMLALKEREQNLKADLSGGQSDYVDEAAFNENIRNVTAYWPEFTFEARKQIIGSLFDSLTVEVTKEVVGAPGKKPEIEITDYQWR